MPAHKSFSIADVLKSTGSGLQVLSFGCAGEVSSTVLEFVSSLVEAGASSLHSVGPPDVHKGVWRSLLRQQYLEEIGHADLLARGSFYAAVLGAIGVPRFRHLRRSNSRRSTVLGDMALLDRMSLDVLDANPGRPRPSRVDPGLRGPLASRL